MKSHQFDFLFEEAEMEDKEIFKIISAEYDKLIAKPRKQRGEIIHPMPRVIHISKEE